MNTRRCTDGARTGTASSAGIITNTAGDSPARCARCTAPARGSSSTTAATPSRCDPKSGEILTAEIFVATLGASKYAHAEATWTQTLPDWIGSNIRMLEFFGSVPSLWIPDFVPGNIIEHHVGDRATCWPGNS